MTTIHERRKRSEKKTRCQEQNGRKGTGQKAAEKQKDEGDLPALTHAGSRGDVDKAQRACAAVDCYVKDRIIVGA